MDFTVGRHCWSHDETMKRPLCSLVACGQSLSRALWILAQFRGLLNGHLSAYSLSDTGEMIAGV